MKKRLFTAFTLSVFIVGIMAAAAMAAKPTFSNGSDINSLVGALTYNTAIPTSTKLTVTASPDLTKVTVNGKSTFSPIEGVTLTVGTFTKGTSTTESKYDITITGTPKAAIKGQKVDVVATNPDGETKLKLTFNSTAENFTVTYSGAAVPGHSSGATRVSGGQTVEQGTKLEAATVKAVPGPVTWKVKDLPKGITYKTTSTDITLSGTYSGLTAFSKAIGATSADAKKYSYVITATNKSVTNDAEISGDVFVVTSPDISTNSLSKLQTEKEYKSALKFKNYPKTVTVGFAATESATSWATDTSGLKDASNNSIGTLKMTSDDKGNYFITGSCDRMPASGKIYAKITATGQYPTTTRTVTKVLPIEFKGIAPVFEKPENLNFDDGNIVFQIKKGTKPLLVSIDVEDKVRQSYGSSKDVNIVGGASNQTDVAFNELDFKVTTKFSTSASDEYLWQATLTPNSTANSAALAQAYKGLKLTLKATNPATGEKVVKKQFAISRGVDTEVVWKQGTSSAAPSSTAGTDVTGTTINIKNKKGGEELAANNANTQAIPAGFAMGTDITNLTRFYTNVPKPYTIALSGDKVNGLEVKFTPNTSSPYTGGLLTITGTPTKSKDTVSKFKLVATNTLTKKKAQVTVNLSAYDAPYFTNSDDLAKGKEVVAGKKVSIKGKMKAHKDILPTVTYTTPSGTNLTNLTNAGLEFIPDTNKGGFEIAGAAGETKPTLNSGKTAYASQDVEIEWKNAYDGTTAKKNKVKLQILPLAPKIKTSKVVYTMTGSTGTNTDNSIELSNMEVNDDGTKLGFGMKDLAGVTLNKTTGVLTIDNSKVTPTKSTAVEVSVDNYGVYGKKNVKFTISAPKPVVTANPKTLTIKGSATDKVESTVTFTADSKTTGGDTKLKWKITTKPEGLTAKIKAASDTKSAVVTVTAKKGSTASGSLTLGVTATNTVSKEDSAEATVTITASAAPEKSSSKDRAEKDTATDEKAVNDKAEAMKEEDVEVGEGDVILGKARTNAALTSTQLKLIAEAGYVVAAVLPEVEVTAAGQYPFAVEIPEEIAAGKELAWFAFPTEPSEDDEIVDFFDDEGADTDVVPESHKITVYPWLNTEVTYAPVIAVKADADDKDTETEEQIKERTVRAVRK